MLLCPEVRITGPTFAIHHAENSPTAFKAPWIRGAEDPRGPRPIPSRTCTERSGPGRPSDACEGDAEHVAVYFLTQ